MKINVKPYNGRYLLELNFFIAKEITITKQTRVQGGGATDAIARAHKQTYVCEIYYVRIIAM